VGETIDHGVTVGPVRNKAGNKGEASSSLRTFGIPDADSMKARTPESPNRPDIRLQPNLNAFDQLLVSSAWLREESIYALL